MQNPLGAAEAAAAAAPAARAGFVGFGGELISPVSGVPKGLPQIAASSFGVCE